MCPETKGYHMRHIRKISEQPLKFRETCLNCGDVTVKEWGKEPWSRMIGDGRLTSYMYL